MIKDFLIMILGIIICIDGVAFLGSLGFTYSWFFFLLIPAWIVGLGFLIYNVMEETD